MMNTRYRKISLPAWMIGLSAVILLAVTGGSSAYSAEIVGAIIKKSGIRVPERGAGAIRYAPSQKQYIINSEGVQINVSLAEVKDLLIPRPGGLDGAIKQVRTGAYSGAIPTLQDIMERYRMLSYDVEAARFLAEAFVNMGQPGKAVEMAEVAIKANPGAAYSGDLSRIYWDALNKAKQNEKLNRVLQEAVENGTREVAATAQVMRGNMQFDKGNYKEALVDGYLRTIVLFQDVKGIQPEALFKAIKAHEKVGEHSHAEKWRKKLLSDYPDSSYSKEIRGT